MKKLFGIFAIVAMAISFISCGNSKTSYEQEMENDYSTEYTNDKDKIEDAPDLEVCPNCNGCGYCDVMEDDPFCYGSGDCPACDGEGRQDTGYGISVCPICQGLGKCTNCFGSGQSKNIETCSTCGGTGWI